jgi:hypothetical protein
MKTNNGFFMALGAALLISAGSAQAGGRSGDALLGGVLGGGVGAVIGQQVGGRDGAIIGGALGAATGVYATTRHRDYRDYRHGSYYDGGYRVIPARPVYYAAPPVYVVPRPVVYYGPRVIHVPAYGYGYRHDHDHGGYRHGGGHGSRHGGHHR